MKKFLAGFVVVAALASCDNSSGSTEQRLDTIGDKIQEATERTIDSAREKGGRLIDKIEDRLDRDTAERRDTTN